jgi:hypothetical protein
VLDVADAERPIGTYVVRSRIPDLVVDVRDSTSAPVGTLHGLTTTFRIDETGGGHIAVLERLRIALDERWHDDRWSLDVVAEPPTLDRRAIVASLVVCHHLVSTGPIDTAAS